MRQSGEKVKTISNPSFAGFFPLDYYFNIWNSFEWIRVVFIEFSDIWLRLRLQEGISSFAWKIMRPMWVDLKHKLNVPNRKSWWFSMWIRWIWFLFYLFIPIYEYVCVRLKIYLSDVLPSWWVSKGSFNVNHILLLSHSFASNLCCMPMSH